jgi:hypothetical protein
VAAYLFAFCSPSCHSDLDTAHNTPDVDTGDGWRRRGAVCVSTGPGFTAMAILARLRKSSTQPWCAKMLARTALPATVHSPATHRVWQRRFYDMNVWSDAKVQEKLKYMHDNPVKRGLARSPDQWRWSSFRYYNLEDSALLAMDRLP